VGHSSLGERQIATHDVAFVRRQPTISNRQWPTWFIKPLAAQEAEGISVPLVEQNARMSLEIADIAYVLYDGIVVYSGTTHELADDEDRVRALAGAEEWTLK
jgi:hypothetical protein